MPRSSPRWEYDEGPGYWVEAPSADLSEAVREALGNYPQFTVDRLLERCAVLGSELRVYEDEYDRAPTYGAESAAAKKIAAEADALAAKLPDLGGIRPEVDERLLESGQPRPDLHRLRDELASLAEAARDVHREGLQGSKGDKRLTRTTVKLGRRLAAEYERILGERPTRWVADSRESAGSASLYVYLLWLIVREYGSRRLTLTAVDHVARDALNEA